MYEFLFRYHIFLLCINTLNNKDIYKIDFFSESEY